MITLKITKICFVILACAFFANLFISNKMAIKGKDMTVLEERKFQLEKEITGLRLEVSSASSLIKVEDRAKKLGFVEMSNSVRALGPSNVAVASRF